jgi:hypothetical protein
MPLKEAFIIIFVNRVSNFATLLGVQAALEHIIGYLVNLRT